MLRTVLLAAALAAPAPALSATIVLDFEEEVVGSHGSSFLSAECGCVTVSGALGQHVIITTFYADPGAGQVLQVGDEGAQLVLDFLVPVLSVSLAFGGDSDDPMVEDFPAVLTGYIWDTEIDSDTVAANRNLLIDQTLTVTSASPMTRATFDFVQLGEFEPYSPMVGTITLTVPEPGAAALLGAAGLGLALARSRSLRCRRTRLP